MGGEERDSHGSSEQGPSGYPPEHSGQPQYPPPQQYPPQYPPPQHYPPPYYPPPGGYRPPQPQPPNNGFAIASMICGILGLIFALPVAGPILAIVFGSMGKKQIAASEGREGGQSMASSGVVMGWIGLPLNLIGIALFFLVFRAVTDTARDVIENLPSILPTITPT